MKTKLNNETTTQVNPYPSHVTEPCSNKDVQAVSREIVDSARDKNNLLESAGNVHFFVRDHYVDVETGTYGIERLIASILRNRSAMFPSGIEKTEFRKVAISAAMFASEIIESVQDTFGKERYPYATVHSYLSHFMTKANSHNKIGKIKLSNAEDSNRPCCKPRIKFYLIEA